MKKAIPIELDKVRNLRFGINAICMVEELTGKPITALAEGAGMKELRTLLYCGLVWEDNTLTLETAGDLMDLAIENKGIDYLSKKLGEAVELALPDKKDKKK